MTDLQKSDVGLTGQQTAPVFQRDDWSLFRTIDGLQQRAGVSKDLLPRLVLKELADNGLHNGATGVVRPLPDQGGYVVEDAGTGIDGEPEDIARLFSISRPMVSSKLLRLAMRGALGNGLRVVAGAVLASGGSLVVTTRNRRIGLRPERNGSTSVTSVEAVAFPVGTRVEIRLGPALPVGPDDSFWGDVACRLAQFGTQYVGKSSPWWYDPDQFAELLYASGNRPVRDLIANLDGCSGAKAGEIVVAAGLGRKSCQDVTTAEAATLLTSARGFTKQVNPKRLGTIGPSAFPEFSYAVADGEASFGARAPQAVIPFVIEAWVTVASSRSITVCVNRTPITGDVRAARDRRDIDAYGCGLHHRIAQASKDVQFGIWVNITTPYMPITSDGKAPDLVPFVDGMAKAVSKAVRLAYRPTSTDKISQKNIVLDNLDAVVALVSGYGA